MNDAFLLCSCQLIASNNKTWLWFGTSVAHIQLCNIGFYTSCLSRKLYKFKTNVIYFKLIAKCPKIGLCTTCRVLWKLLFFLFEFWSQNSSWSLSFLNKLVYRRHITYHMWSNEQSIFKRIIYHVLSEKPMLKHYFIISIYTFVSCASFLTKMLLSGQGFRKDIRRSAMFACICINKTYLIFLYRIEIID